MGWGGVWGARELLLCLGRPRFENKHLLRARAPCDNPLLIELDADGVGGGGMEGAAVSTAAALRAELRASAALLTPLDTNKRTDSFI